MAPCNHPVTCPPAGAAAITAFRTPLISAHDDAHNCPVTSPVKPGRAPGGAFLNKCPLGGGSWEEAGNVGKETSAFSGAVKLQFKN